MSSDRISKRKAVNDVRKQIIDSLYSPPASTRVVPGAAPPAKAPAPATPKKSVRYARGPSTDPADNFARRRRREQVG
jgi:hypothetical protein